MSQIAAPFGVAETVGRKELIKDLWGRRLQSDRALNGALDRGKHVEN